MTSVSASRSPSAPFAPGPRGMPFLGNLPALRRDRIRIFLEAADTYGDVVRFQFGPGPRHVAHLLRHPDHIKYVFVDAAERFTKQTPGIDAIRPVLGNGLLTSEGAFWRRQRRIAQPAFHKQRIAAFAGVMVRAADELVDGWMRRPRPDAPVDVAGEMMRVALRIVTETLLGTDVPIDAAATASALDFILDDSRKNLTRLLKIPRSVPTPDNRRFQEAIAVLDREVFRIIEHRRKAREGGTDLVSMLMATRDPETGEGMTDRQLRDEVMTMFAAGHETTANALAWTFYLLSTHPDVRRRARAEVFRVLGDRLPDFTDIGALDLVGRVFQESMRLYPPAWMISRRVAEDDVVGGYSIPKDSLALVSPFVTHRHPSYWENPEGFDPDRFAGGALSRMPRFAYFPFGGGARQCIGSSFAMVEGTLVLATILRRVRLDLVPGQTIEPEPGITLRPRDGIHMRVVPEPLPS
ncbi:cytochrome P450 [Polyangium sp. 15x6]|uniref:cytochrome P450 n=1 Tax=Polyangium sp. 15x6 TaxID=3042687 RepID=UPI00249A27A3|nr:cytochrome P450 [Polyangium sp. 15x6]MDI3281698.1 cytochrome P450 [Polyangium sp. 15x6]